MLLLVLSLLSAPIAFGFTTGTPESRLPACCRKGGKHHCMEQMGGVQGSGPAFTAAPHHCPLYPGCVTPGFTDAKLFVPAPGAAFFAAIVSHPTLQAQTEARYRIASERSRLKRGPPALL